MSWGVIGGTSIGAILAPVISTLRRRRRERLEAAGLRPKRVSVSERIIEANRERQARMRAEYEARKYRG